ncbi:MAG: SurA N-terminal domain-containing protein [Holosporaceae bacterium]|jgi:peptidyl-prolyl cis-trans isomerase D|nr:SurA N-terminal domain-containing protein [Holosporaceae bacterium]
MLKFIREHSKSRPVKIFLSFLALSFIVSFGISALIQKITGKDYIVKIGKIKISPIEFKIEKARRLGMLRGHMSDANEKDMTANILHQLIRENVIDQAALEYGIIVSDETIKKYISGIDMFRDKDGRFNANLLRGFLQKIQVPEAMFLESSKNDIKNTLLKMPFIFVSIAPEFENFTCASLEKRTVVAVELRPSSFNVVENPSPEESEEFFGNNPDLFTINETRSFRILELPESSLEKNITVSEEEIRDIYDRSPEKEDSSYENMKKEIEAGLRQERLQTEANEVTRQIEDALMAGDDVTETAKKFGLNILVVEDVDADNKNKKDEDVLAVPYKSDILAVAFSVDDGGDSSFSEAFDAKGERVYWLLHIDGITPKHVASFEESSDKVLKEWTSRKRREKAEETASDLVERIKAGDNLISLARKSGYASVITQKFDRFGKLEDEKNTKFKNIIEEIYEDAFTLGKSEANFKKTDEKFVVYQVHDVVSPGEIGKEDEEKYQRELRSEIVDDMYQQLISYLSKKKYEVKINHDLLKNIDENVTQNQLDDMF